MRRLPVLIQSEGSKQKRAAPGLASRGVVRPFATDQSTPVSSTIVPNQRRRAEFRPAVRRAWFFSSSSVGFAAEVPSPGTGWATIPGGQLSRPASIVRDARGKLWAGIAAGRVGGRSTCAHGGRVSLRLCSLRHLNASSVSLLPALPRTHSTPTSWL